MVDSIAEAIKELKKSSKLKRKVSSSVSSESEEEKMRRKKKSKTSVKKASKKVKVTANVPEERQTHLEDFLCSQVEKLNSELAREREWRDQVANIYLRFCEAAQLRLNMLLTPPDI